MSMSWLITTLAITAFFSSQLAYAYDPNPLQDICVGVTDTTASVFLNGKFCKDPKLAKADDFFFSGLNVSGNPMSNSGFAANVVDVNTMPGLNTLGISIVRADFEPGALVPLHTHPRATELITILEGTIYAGFLAPDANVFKSRLFSKILNPGDVFVIPQGLIHFQYNVGHKSATLLASFNSQNPGVVTIPNSIFASDPPILDDVLVKGFQLDKEVIKQLRKKFS
ncbi:germin-like protein subfamily 1 member 17 [Nicotiana tabacum]|uniref:Germin-like protein n=2 Tax=Nicotiana TaxID=4085 RepID=A0A1S3YPF5_TOBAC|nr:PREDICTED: germin-like protein subfamily 1 member 17 [Nicotiana sylvestris]XP_016453983.1 PREDICTED: germin-like protein subfamily 1 member 17 [Nicotiana tabacum]